MKLSLSRRRSIALFAGLLALSAVLVAGLPVAAQGPVGMSFPPSEGTEWGASQDLGDGSIQTFVTLDEAGNPSLVGVYFTESALTGLPETPSDGTWDVTDAEGNVVIPCCGHEVVLEFPESASTTIFKHFLLDWTPMGHEPPGVYDLPHFDLHFFMTTNEERTAIVAATADTMCSVPNPPDVGGEHPVPVTCETFEEAMMPLPDDQVPPGYVAAGAVAPGMGNHLINMAAPEVAEGEPFTHTWIFGTYAGKMTFLEPMITIAFFQELTEDVCTPIAMPEAVAESGFYPSEYCIRRVTDENGGEGGYAVSLESFVEYEAAAQ